MNRAAAITALLLSCATAAVAQWSWVHPKLQGHALNDVVFLDENTALAVGNYGTVMRSSDAGATWSLAKATYLGNPIALNRLARMDDNTAIASEPPYLAKTTDAGVTWTVWEGPVSYGPELDMEFFGSAGLMSFAGPLPDTGKLYRSHDGGLTWTLVLDGPRCLAIHFISESLVVAVAEFAFLRSEDGGLTWTESPFAYVPVGWNQTSISFADAQHGVVAKMQHVYTTSDGGVSWTESLLDPVFSESTTECSELAMIDASTIVVSARHTGCDVVTGDCRWSGQFLRSTDAGMTWQSEWGPRQFEGLAHNGNGVVLSVGSGGSIYRWTNTAWERASGNEYERLENGSAAAFTDPQHGVVVGVAGGASITTSKTVVLRTHDGGATWGAAALWQTEITDVAFSPDGTAAYAVGRQFIAGANHRMVLKSLDGGASWSFLWSTPASSSNSFRSVAFGSNSLAIAAGPIRNVIVIDNEVVTEHTLSGAENLNAVAFADPTTAVVAGAGGFMFRSTDGGASWTFVAAPVPINVEDVAFASPQIGVAIGTNYWVRTTDGGASWQPISMPILYAHRLGFGPNGYGIAVKRAFEPDPRAAETMDYGASWTPIETPLSANTDNVTVFEPLHATMSGPDLHVIQYLRLPVSTAIISFHAVAGAFAVELAWSLREAAELSELRIYRTEGSIPKVFAGIGTTRRAFRDGTVVPGREYEYTLVAIDRDGFEIQSAPIRVATSKAELALLPNVPNPFNPSTMIRYVIPSRKRVRVTIYDVAGRAVKTLVDREEAAGQYDVPWNGTDASGDPVSSGVYLVRIEAGKQSLSRKMVLLK